MPASNLRFGAFDSKKKREIEDENRAAENSWPNPTPGVSGVKVTEPIFTGLGGTRSSSVPAGSDTVSGGTIDESPLTEMDVLKSRFGLGSRAIDPEQNAIARQNFLSNPTKTGIRDLIPEGNTNGDYLAIMSRDAQNRAISESNNNEVARAEAAAARQQEAIKNALAQEAAFQENARKQQEAERLQEFFAATGLPPSPQAAAAFSLERGRQTAASQFTEAIKGLIIQKQADYDKLMKGYEGLPDEQLPPAIRRAKDQIDQKYQDIENKMVLAAGLQSGTNNPGNMVSKDQVQQLVP